MINQALWWFRHAFSLLTSKTFLSSPFFRLLSWPSIFNWTAKQQNTGHSRDVYGENRQLLDSWAMVIFLFFFTVHAAHSHLSREAFFCLNEKLQRNGTVFVSLDVEVAGVGWVCVNIERERDRACENKLIVSKIKTYRFRYASTRSITTSGVWIFWSETKSSKASKTTIWTKTSANVFWRSANKLDRRKYINRWILIGWCYVKFSSLAERKLGSD